MLRRLLEQFELTNRRHALLKKGDALVVGVSGGPDSTALLKLLCKLQRKYALRLNVAHLDHALQTNSQKVQALARKTAEKNGVPFHTKKVNVRQRALKKKLSLEDAGRQERYRFFEAVAKKTGSNKIATAHTLDDQAETMLMRLMRGSGMRGLTGIPYKRKHGQFEIVRPILDCSKKDLILFLKKERLSFVQDRMNRDPLFLRNRVRHQLLPVLEKHFNPQIKQALASLQSICRDTQNYLQSRAVSVFHRCRISEGPRKIVFDASRLRALHPALRFEILAASITKLRGDVAGFGYTHWSSVDSLLSSSQKNLQAHWPHGVRVKKTGRRLTVSV